MKQAKTIIGQSLIGLLPIAYLLSIWKTLPESVPLHYNINFVADKFGSRFELLGVLCLMVGICIGTSLLIINLPKLDPKKKYESTTPLILKITWILTIFLTLVSTYIVYQTQRYTQGHTNDFSLKYMIALVPLLFAILGNYMNNIKPNYFVGFRTPWNLENEDNWRKTHHLGSKVWFFGGMLMFILVVILPTACSIYIIIGGIIPLTIIPIWYSYSLYKQQSRA